jgi:hypothetical protein
LFAQSLVVLRVEAEIGGACQSVKQVADAGVVELDSLLRRAPPISHGRVAAFGSGAPLLRDLKDRNCAARPAAP